MGDEATAGAGAIDGGGVGDRAFVEMGGVGERVTLPGAAGGRDSLESAVGEVNGFKKASAGEWIDRADHSCGHGL